MEISSGLSSELRPSLSPQSDSISFDKEVTEIAATAAVSDIGRQSLGSPLKSVEVLEQEATLNSHVKEEPHNLL